MARMPAAAKEFLASSASARVRKLAIETRSVMVGPLTDCGWTGGARRLSASSKPLEVSRPAERTGRTGDLASPRIAGEWCSAARGLKGLKVTTEDLTRVVDDEFSQGFLGVVPCLRHRGSFGPKEGRPRSFTTFTSSNRLVRRRSISLPRRSRGRSCRWSKRACVGGKHHERITSPHVGEIVAPDDLYRLEAEVRHGGKGPGPCFDCRATALRRRVGRGERRRLREEGRPCWAAFFAIRTLTSFRTRLAGRGLSA